MLNRFACLLLLTGCQSSYFDGLPDDGDLALPLAQVSTAGDGAESTYAMALVRRAPILADINGGLPLVITEGRPIAGVPWRCAWSTRPTGPFPLANVALLVTLKQPPPPQLIPGGGGSMLMVPPDLVFRPGGFLSQNDGLVELRTTFPPQSVGLHLWVQLVVEDARTTAGVTCSPMLELIVGDR